MNFKMLSKEQCKYILKYYKDIEIGDILEGNGFYYFFLGLWNSSLYWNGNLKDNNSKLVMLVKEYKYYPNENEIEPHMLYFDSIEFDLCEIEKMKKVGSYSQKNLFQGICYHDVYTKILCYARIKAKENIGVVYKIKLDGEVCYDVIVNLKPKRVLRMMRIPTLKDIIDGKNIKNMLYEEKDNIDERYYLSEDSIKYVRTLQESEIKKIYLKYQLMGVCK